MSTNPTEKRRPGRPPTGRTPDPERSAKSRANLLASGGHRLSVNLSPTAAVDLATVMAAEGGINQKAAVELALRAYVESL